MRAQRQSKAGRQVEVRGLAVCLSGLQALRQGQLVWGWGRHLLWCGVTLLACCPHRTPCGTWTRRGTTWTSSRGCGWGAGGSVGAMAVKPGSCSARSQLFGGA